MEIISVPKFAKMIKIAKLPYFAPNMQRKKADPVSNVRMCISTKTLLCMLTYGGGFLLSEFTTIKITEIMPIVVQAPLKFAVDVVMVAMADFLLFKQKITKIQFAQIGLALISGVLFVL